MPITIDIPVARRRLRINGIVQGVGFRPFVYRLANRYELSGFVNNDSHGVCIEIEGPLDRLEEFSDALALQAPPLSKIGEITTEELRPTGEDAFRIAVTRRSTTAVTHISPDVAVCDDCLAELLDPADRRHQYPFTNCTNCGPRYTIVRRIPYDRPNTSMDRFELCGKCDSEYTDPSDRRFHAQPNACPTCGPHLTLCDSDGNPVQTEDPLAAAAELLRTGKIVAVRARMKPRRSSSVRAASPGSASHALVSPKGGAFRIRRAISIRTT